MKHFILLLTTLLLSGCLLLMPQNNQFDELKELARSYDGTAAQLLQDSDRPPLTHALRQLVEEEERLSRTLEKLTESDQINPEQAQQLRTTHQQLRSLRIRKSEAILEHYDEKIIDFFELNRWRLLPEAVAQLATVEWSHHCTAAKRLVIYGYGDPIGGVAPTQQISDGRAHSVAQWIIANSRCREKDMIIRGLGIDIRAEQIQTANLTLQEQERIFRQSRYVRILIPK